MKHILSTTAIATLLLSGMAHAQDDSSASASSESSMQQSESQSSSMSSSSAMANSGDTGPFGTYEESDGLEIFASDFIGKRIYASEGEISSGEGGGVNQEWNDLGEVNELLMSQDGQVDYAVLGVGGFLGIGERDVLVQMDEIEIVQNSEDPTDYFLVIQASQQQIENAPEFDSNAVNASEQAATETGQAAESAASSAESSAESAASSAESAAESAASSAESSAESAAQEAESAAEEAASAAESAAEEAGDAAESAGEEVEAETNN